MCTTWHSISYLCWCIPYRDAVIIWLFSIQCHQGVADIAQEFSEKKPSPQDTTIYHTWTAYKKKQTSWIGWSYSITTVYIQFMPSCTLILILAIFPTSLKYGHYPNAAFYAQHAIAFTTSWSSCPLLMQVERAHVFWFKISWFSSKHWIHPTGYTILRASLKDHSKYKSSFNTLSSLYQFLYQHGLMMLTFANLIYLNNSIKWTYHCKN